MAVPFLQRDRDEEELMDDLRISDLLSIPASELEANFARSGGPGGQNVNKVNSKVTVRWRLQDNQTLGFLVRQRLVALAGTRLNQDGSIQVTSQEHRDQPANLRACYDKLRWMIAEASKPVKVRRPTRPSRASQRRRLDEKKAQSAKKSGRNRSGWE